MKHNMKKIFKTLGIMFGFIAIVSILTMVLIFSPDWLNKIIFILSMFYMAKSIYNEV